MTSIFRSVVHSAIQKSIQLGSMVQQFLSNHWSFLVTTVDFTFARSGTQTFTDFEGLVKTVPADESAHVGARMVENIVTPAVSPFGGSWTQVNNSGTAAFFDNGTHATVHFDDSSDRLTFLDAALQLDDADVRLTVEVRQTVGIADSIRLGIFNGSTFQHLAAIDPSRDEWVRITTPVTNMGTTAAGAQIQIRGAFTTPVDFQIRNIQFEVVTGQANQNPSEFVDGVDFSLFKNGNSVDGDGVVTDARGSLITKDNTSIVIYGDSLTDGADEGDYGQTITQRTGHVFRTEGVPGDTLAQIRAVMVADAPKPNTNFVILEGGVNTINAAVSDPVPGMLSEMATMVAHAVANNLDYLIINVTPWKNFAGWTAQKQTWTDSYNSSISSTYPTKSVDMYSVMEDPGNADELLPAYDIGDGLHFSADGGDAADAVLAAALPARNAKGALLEAAITNKCTNHNLNPSDLTNVTKSGDAAATLTLVDDSANMPPELSVIANGNAFKLDNTSGVTPASAIVTGTVGNTNVHTASAWVRSTGTSTSVTPNFGISSPGGADPFSSTAYRRLEVTKAPDATFRSLLVTCNPGEVAYFIGNQLEERTFASSVIETTGATSARSPTTMPRTRSFPSNNFSGQVKVRPKFDGADDKGSTLRLFTVTADATGNDRFEITYDQTTDSIGLTKVLGGTSVSASKAGAGYIAGDLLNIRFRFDSTGIYLWVNDLALTSNGTGVGPTDWSTLLQTILIGRLYTGDNFMSNQEAVSHRIYNEAKSDSFLENLE